MTVDPAQIELTDEQKKRLATIAERQGRDYHDLVDQFLFGFHLPEDSPSEDSFGKVVRKNLSEPGVLRESESKTPPQEDDFTKEPSLYNLLAKRGVLGCLPTSPQIQSTWKDLGVTVEKILVDTGPLVALFDWREQHYQSCRDQARTLKPGTLFTCLPVVVEAAYLLNRQDSRLYLELLDAIHDEVYKILPIEASEFPAIAKITKKYANLGLDFADGCLMYLAERDAISHVFTLDRRDFSLYRTAKGEALTLLPN